MTTASTILICFLTASAMFAKPREKTYPTNCNRVWAVVKLVTVKPNYSFAMLDDAQQKGMFTTGSVMSGRRTLDVTLSGEGESCTVSVEGNFSGITHDDKGDLFKRLEQGFKIKAK